MLRRLQRSKRGGQPKIQMRREGSTKGHTFLATGRWNTLRKEGGGLRRRIKKKQKRGHADRARGLEHSQRRRGITRGGYAFLREKSKKEEGVRSK